jgi:S1-C subfamily serine protease
MKKLLFATLFALATVFNAAADDVVTSFASDPYIHVKSMKVKARLYEVKLTELITYVTIEIVPTHNIKLLPCWTSNETYVISGDAELPLLGLYDQEANTFRSCTYNDGLGWQNAKARHAYRYTLAFSGRLPEGYVGFNLIDRAEQGRGYSFRNRTINNPVTSKSPTIDDYKLLISHSNDKVCGIYEEQGGNNSKLACIKIDGSYVLAYLDSANRKPWWFMGDRQSYLRPTRDESVFEAAWITENKLIEKDCYVKFDGKKMTFYPSKIKNEPHTYVKTYPQSENSAHWGGGTAFALANNYVVTNHHVIKNSNEIYIVGVDGDFQNPYKAVVVAEDAVNDLAILKVEGVNIDSKNIPYAIRTEAANLGEYLFVMGYPNPDLMGANIKLTEGTLNSRTGFMGDVANYQMSATIHGGNSGSPVFDKNGNVIGIAVASINIALAENVNYAIKTLYLSNLIDSVIGKDILPKSNKISKLELPEKAKHIENYVYQVICKKAAKQ